MSFSEFVSPLIGRLALAWFFASQAIADIVGFDSTMSLMTFRHVPAAPAVLVLALVILAFGAVSLALGFQTRYGAMFLFAYMLIVAVAMHDYWNVHKLADRVAEFDIFARDIAIAGGLLVMVGMGPGGLALDNRGKKK